MRLCAGRPSDRLRRVGFVASVLLACGGLLAVPPDVGAQDKHKDHSDLDADGDVDLEDLKLFSTTRLETDWTEIDWPTWVVDDANQRWDKHYHRLFVFIYAYFDLTPGEDPLAVRNQLKSPTRLAIAPNDQMWVSDPGVGSVFLLNANRVRIAELRGFDQPLGIALDNNGRLYVGDDLRDRIEVFQPDGTFVRTIGAGLVKKPVDIEIHDDLIYVVDPEASVVWVFDMLGNHKRTIRRGMLAEPAAVEIATRVNDVLQTVTEIYVLDKNDYFVKVYDTNGVLLRFFGGFPTSSGWWVKTWYPEGKFVSPQSLFIADDGKLHVLDIYMKNVQILDPVTGDYESEYGEVGDADDEYRLPLDIEQNSEGETLATDSQRSRVGVIR